MSTTSRTGSRTFPSTHQRWDVTTAREAALWALVAAGPHLPHPEVSEVVAVSRRPQPGASEVVELPASVALPVPVVLPVAVESPIAGELPVPVELQVEELEIVEQAPQASRDSDSLFRQPLLLSFFVLNVSR